MCDSVLLLGHLHLGPCPAAGPLQRCSLANPCGSTPPRAPGWAARAPHRHPGRDGQRRGGRRAGRAPGPAPGPAGDRRHDPGAPNFFSLSRSRAALRASCRQRWLADSGASRRACCGSGSVHEVRGTTTTRSRRRTRMAGTNHTCIAWHLQRAEDRGRCSFRDW